MSVLVTHPTNIAAMTSREKTPHTGAFISCCIVIKDQSPLEVYGTEFFVDGPQLGFLGKTFELLLVLPQAIKLEKSRGTTELKYFVDGNLRVNSIHF